MWVGGVADSQTRSKPLKTPPNHPENRPFRPKFHLLFSQISQNPGVGGWKNRFGRNLPKKNGFESKSRRLVSSFLFYPTSKETSRSFIWKPSATVIPGSITWCSGGSMGALSKPTVLVGHLHWGKGEFFIPRVFSGMMRTWNHSQWCLSTSSWWPRFLQILFVFGQAFFSVLQVCPAIDVAYFLAPSTTGEVIVF